MSRSIDARLGCATAAAADDSAVPPSHEYSSRHHADRILVMAASALSDKNMCETAAGGKKDVPPMPLLRLDSDDEDELGAFIYKSSITARKRQGKEISHQSNAAVLDRPVDISRNNVKNNSEYKCESSHRDIIEVNESVFARRWDAQFAALQRYKNEHGDCLVPKSYMDPKLVSWVQTQRRDAKAGKVADERMKRLDSIGFAFGVKCNKWYTQFAALQRYKIKHGNCLVPQKYSDDPQLGSWVLKQREHAKANTMSYDRMKRLDIIGFVFRVRDNKWDEQFAALQRYKNKHGNCLVPQKYIDDPKLGRWVKVQRKLSNEGKMPDDRMKRLDSIGFVFDVKNNYWDIQFGALQRYKNEHGHCLVPQRYSGDPQLGYWIQNQHANAKVGKVSDDRMKRLQSIGFAFDAQDTRPKE